MSVRMSMIGRIERLLDWVQWACILMASVAVAVLIATFGWLVFGRYVLNITPTWVEQLALLLICYIAFLGAAAGVREDTHLGVTLFRDMLPVRAQKVVMIVIDFLLSGFGAIMCIAGISLMIFGWDSRLPMLNIPESFRTLAITLCGGLICLIAGMRGLIRVLTFSQWQPDASALPAPPPAGQEI